MWYIASRQIYATLVCFDIDCNNKLLYKKNVTIFSAYHMHVTKQPHIDTTICKVYSKEEGRTSNMITTANCIEEI